MLLTVYCPCTYSSSGQSDLSCSGAVIGGAVGGTILFIIVTMLLIMMLWCVRASHKKKAYPIDNSYLNVNVSYAVELGSNATTAEKMKEKLTVFKQMSQYHILVQIHKQPLR